MPIPGSYCAGQGGRGGGRAHLDAQVDVLLDAEAKVASLGEVALAQLVLLDLEAALEAARSAPPKRVWTHISSAFGPRIVTCTAIFSLRRIEKVRTV